MARYLHHRAGFSFLELQIALVLFGLAVAGLGPLVVMQSRQMKQLEDRFSDQSTYYLVPARNAWARKLGASAELTQDPPKSAEKQPVFLIDNGNAGYSEQDIGSQDWRTVYRWSALGRTYRRNNGGRISDEAYWQFSELRAGWYQVLVTYPSWRFHASNSPYAVYDGSVHKQTVPINQRVPPRGGRFAGVRWNSLGLFSITSGELRVKLSDRANGYIAADAVRIVPIRNELRVLTFDKSLNDDAVSVEVSIIQRTPS